VVSNPRETQLTATNEQPDERQEHSEPGQDCRLRRWLVHFRSGTEWYTVGEFLGLDAPAAIARAIEVLGEGAGYRAEAIPWDAAPLCRLKPGADPL
jgi:hypothetical protein